MKKVRVMLVREIKELAKNLGVELPKKGKKEDLVHAIQIHENNWPCYATGWCWKEACLWHTDCQKEFVKKEKKK